MSKKIHLFLYQRNDLFRDKEVFINLFSGQQLRSVFWEVNIKFWEVNIKFWEVNIKFWKVKYKVLVETLPLEPNRRIRIFLLIWIQEAKMSQIRILGTAIASNKHNHNKNVNLIFLVDFPAGSVSRTSFDPSKAGRIGISVSKYP